MRRILWLPAALVLALVVAAPASAAAPNVFVVVDEGRNEVACDGFTVVQEFRATIRVKEWLDDSGDLIRVIANVRWEGTLTNSETGFSIRDNASWTDFFDVASGDFAQAGLIWSLNVPGEGIVLLDAGQIIFHPDGSVTIHGPHQFFESGLELLCAALA